MIEKNLKVIHTGDIQIEVRNHQQRFDEFKFLFEHLENILKSEQPDLYVISGDIFENWNANDVERKLFIDHINNVLNIKSIKEIAVQDGNHDINQRKDSNLFKTDGKDELVKNPLETIFSSINDTRIIYMDSSSYYFSNNIPGLCYFNWAQKVKHSPLSEISYNPIQNYSKEETKKILETHTCITLYHDPIQECINFDGNPLRGSNEQLSVKDIFVTNSVLAGDIHMPQILNYGSEKDPKLFIYCSSPIQRNFGEGDYYQNGKLYQHGVTNHLIQMYEIEQKGNIISKIQIQIPQFNSYNTFKLGNDVLDPKDINWKIENPGTKKSTIRISYPSASEKYINWESQIPELIKTENPGINIVFSQSMYGKGITTEDVDDTKTLNEVNELLSIEKVIEISKDYIKNIVQRTSTISAEDKEKCISYIEELFISELKNFNTELESNDIRLVDLCVSNFMSFGDNINVKLDNIGLTKLTGANGVGKTTLYHFIKWMTTGFISIVQNQNHKNANNLLVFNDYRWNIDGVKGELNFYNNGIPYKINRDIERVWKRNTTDEQKKSKDWRTFIQTTNETVSVINMNDNTVVSGDASTELLNSFFRGINNLSRLVFVNDSTLESMIKTDTPTLVEEILCNIGFNYFDMMLRRYDELKSEKMESLSKPSISIDVLQQQLLETEKLHNEIANQSISVKNELLQIKNEISNIENDKFALVSKKHQVTKDAILNLEGGLEYDIKNYEHQVQMIQKNIKEYHENPLYSIDVEKLKLDIKAKKDEHINVSETYNKSLVDKSVHDANIESKKTELINLYNTIENEMLAGIKEERFLIDQQISKVNQLKSELNTLSANFTIDVQSEVSKLVTKESEINLEISKIGFEISKLDSLLLQLNNKIHDLQQEPNICSECKQPLPKEKQIERELHINKMFEEIKNAELEKRTHNTNLVSQTENLNKIRWVINEIKSGNYEVNSNLSIANNNYQIALKTKNNEISDLENIISDSQKITTIKEQQIKESVKQHELIIKSSNDIQVMIEKSLVLQEDVNAKKLIFDNSASEIFSLENTLYSVNDLREMLVSEENALQIQESKLPLFESRRNDINEKKTQLLENEKLDLSILALTNEQNEKNVVKTGIEARLSEMEIKGAGITTKIETIRKDIENAIQYRIIEASFKQYKTLLGKKGLPLYIFSLIRPILNSKLNDLLSDMDFRLQFIEDNSLQMLDLSKPGTPIRSPFTISGMQTVFCGLSLLYINRNCNVSFKMKELFIDEVSGKLNDGKDLEYDSMNYQMQLKKLLRRFNDLNIFIVDHVIDDMEEDTKLQVIPTNDGAQIIKIEI